MPTNRIRRTRCRATWGDGITEAEYIFFTWGDFFEAEDFAKGKTEDELFALWLKHRAAILERFHAEAGADFIPWAIEKWGAEYANK